MGPSDDDQATVPVGQSSKIQGAMKLMALDTDDRHERSGLSCRFELIQVVEVCVDILVDRSRFGGVLIDKRGNHTPYVRYRAIGHEPTMESLDVSVDHVLTGFDDHNLQGRSLAIRHDPSPTVYETTASRETNDHVERCNLKKQRKKARALKRRRNHG
jgi:hypothetical protein